MSNNKYETLKTIDDINSFFAGHVGRGVQLWHYSISHSWLTLCMMHAGQAHWKNSTAEYTTINCHMVNAMTIPKIAWKSDLIATEFDRSESSDYGNSTKTLLEDRSTGTVIDCDHLFLWVGRHPDREYNVMPTPEDAG